MSHANASSTKLDWPVSVYPLESMRRLNVDDVLLQLPSEFPLISLPDQLYMTRLSTQKDLDESPIIGLPLLERFPGQDRVPLARVEHEQRQRRARLRRHCGGAVPLAVHAGALEKLHHQVITITMYFGGHWWRNRGSYSTGIKHILPIPPAALFNVIPSLCPGPFSVYKCLLGEGVQELVIAWLRYTWAQMVLAIGSCKLHKNPHDPTTQVHT